MPSSPRSWTRSTARHDLVGELRHADIPPPELVRSFAVGMELRARPVRQRGDGSWEFSVRGLLPSTWRTAERAIAVDDVVLGPAQSVRDFGAFVEVLPRVAGLVHISEVDWTYVGNVSEFVTPGHVVAPQVQSLIDELDAAAVDRKALRDQNRELKQQLRSTEDPLLVAAAEQRPVQEWKRTHPGATAEALRELRRRGSERGLLYLLVGFTGLRKNERAGLRWLDLLLDGDDPAVSLRAEITKNRQDSRIPLVPWLARALRERWKERGEWQGRPVRHSDSVFHVPDRIARLVRGDAAWAELGEKEPTWHRLDFHALRGSSDLLTWPGIQRPAGG